MWSFVTSHMSSECELLLAHFPSVAETKVVESLAPPLPHPNDPSDLSSLAVDVYSKGHLCVLSFLFYFTYCIVVSHE